MITKAIVRSISKAGNRCVVRMPLFETASDMSPVEAEALVSITPGLFNNLFPGDVVFVAFEENALEKPIILGKLYKGTATEKETPGGAGILDSLLVRTAAEVPCTTFFRYPNTQQQNHYQHLDTPKDIANYILWLENLAKTLINRLAKNFECFKNWTQWQLKAENVEVDDGNIDSKSYKAAVKCQYQAEDDECKVCSNTKCTKNHTRTYQKVNASKNYPSNDF